jgi:hypothetical protein
MPAGDDVTPPLPVPPFEMRSVGSGTGSTKPAVTVVLELRVSVHVPVPLQPPPDQPVNVEPASAAAVSVMLVPGGNDAEHVDPQSMPAGEDVTVPVSGSTLRDRQRRAASVNAASPWCWSCR